MWVGYLIAERGFGDEQLVEMQKIIDAEKSDLFDVLTLRGLRPGAAHTRRTRWSGKSGHQHALQ